MNFINAQPPNNSQGPISIQFDKIQLPQFVERIDNNKGWVTYGNDNLYPQYLATLLSKSPIHSSIVTQKARMLGGYGFLKTNLDIKTMLFLKNSRNEMDMDEILYRAAYDFEVYGAFALNVIWSRDRETISEVSYIDVSKIRIQSPDKENKYPMLENYWVSDGWENPRKYEPVLYQGFSTRSKKKASQIYYIKDNRAGTEYYGIPNYLSATRWMETDYLISDYHTNSIQNGFSPKYIVIAPLMGASDEEKRAFANKFRVELQGTSGAQYVVHYVDDPNDAPKFEAVQENNSDSRFLMLEEATQKSILYAHQITNPILFVGDIFNKSSLGARNETLEALELFQNAYLTPRQNILAKVFNRLARINGIKDDLIINKYSENFKKVDTNIQDVLDILQSTLTPEQKYFILVANGYTHEVAMNFTGFKQGNELKEGIEEAVQPVQPAAPKNNPIPNVKSN